MELPNYYIEILVSVIIGLISSLVFDFFRSLRKLKKTRNTVVMFQDILYFVIIFIIIIIAIYNFLDDDLRMYMIIFMLASSFIYFKFLSNFIVKFYIFILKRFEIAIQFIFVTFKFHSELIKKIMKILHKFVKKCCKKNLNMIIYIWNKVRFIPKFKQKKKVKNEK